MQQSEASGDRPRAGLTDDLRADLREWAAVAEAGLAGVRTALLLGAEGPGLTPAALAVADVRVRIPMTSGVDSLNVATAGAVAFHEARRSVR